MDKETRVFTYDELLNKETLLFPTTSMNLEGIMLSEIARQRTNSTSSHLYEASEQVQLTEVDMRMGVIEGWRGSYGR